MRYDKDWDLEYLESNIREYVDEQMAVGFLSPAEIVDSAIAIYQEDGDLCVVIELVEELTDEALRKHVYEQAFWPDTTDPFKRRGRPCYYVGPLNAGNIHVPRLSTGVKDKQTAKSMEASLHELAITYPDLVERVAAGDLTLQELYTARVRGEAALRALREPTETAVDDPSLLDIIGEEAGDGTPATGLRAILTDNRVLAGLDQLLDLAPEGATLSWLGQPRNLSALYARALKQGRKPNSVRRSLHRAVSEVLVQEIGRGRMLAIMADAKVPSEYDERVVGLTPAELDRLLAACDEEVRDIVEAAVLTGVDQGPLLRLRPTDFRDSLNGATLHVHDTKTASRMREIPLSRAAARLFQRAVAARALREPVFALTYQQLRGRWEAARKAVGLEHVRFKDLRGVFATAFLAAGGNVKDLQHILGHTTPAMTLRYIRRLPLRQQGAMDGAAQVLGLDGTHPEA